MTRAAARKLGRAGALALVLAVPAGPAAALSRNGTLAQAASDTDFYQVSCSDDGSGAPQSLVAQVLDLAPVAAPIVSVQAQKASPAIATSTSDAVDGDAGASPATFLNGGAGTYDVFVDKSAAGAEGYTLTVQCTTAVDGGGVPTGTTLVPIAVGEVAVPSLSPGPLALLAAGFGVLGAVALRRRASLRGIR